MSAKEEKKGLRPWNLFVQTRWRQKSSFSPNLVSVCASVCARACQGGSEKGQRFKIVFAVFKRFHWKRRLNGPRAPIGVCSQWELP